MSKTRHTWRDLAILQPSAKAIERQGRPVQRWLRQKSERADHAPGLAQSTLFVSFLSTFLRLGHLGSRASEVARMIAPSAHSVRRSPARVSARSTRPFPKR